MTVDEETARDLISRARAIRTAAHVPLTDVGTYIGCPAGLLGKWERHTPDLQQLDRRDQLAVGRWAVILAGLDTGGPR